MIYIILLVIVVWAVMVYNSLVSLRNKVKEGFSTMDVFMKKRFDLIPNLVQTVKGYASHEAEVLEKVVALRNGASSMEAKLEADKQISQALRNLYVQVEAYPELKASQNFLNLQDQLQHVEEDIANARRYYNGCVRIYNTKIEQFPGVLIANLFHFSQSDMYEVADAAERENVKVDFGK